MNIALSNLVTCFNLTTIGTKVVDRDAFMEILYAAVADYDFTAEDSANGVVKGQGFVGLSDEAISTLISGVGKHTHQPEDYVVRKHRGSVGLFLKREKAETPTGVAAIVYTREAYLADPEVQEEVEEAQRIEQSDCTHVLVAVLAFAGPKAPVGFVRFVKNLAGGNKAYTPESTTHEALIKEAKTVEEYHDTWCTVSD